MTKTVRPTIDDVAALSGVGRTTVSRVLNGGPNVRAEVRDRVLNAVEKLQYKVNVQARFLAGGRSQLIAMIHASDLDAEPNSFYHSGLELGALRACSDAGFQLLMHGVNQHALNRANKVIDLIDSRRCDGVILTPPFSDDAELISLIHSRNVPVVAVSPGRNLHGTVIGVGIDDEVAGYELTRHMLKLGHRRFGFIKGLEGHASAEERFQGFVRALREAGIDPEAVPAARGNFAFRSGVDLSLELLNRRPRPTVLICANDDMATGALFTAHKMGLSLPEDLSVVGFDDTPVSEIVWPPLTTVHQPIKQIGARAVEQLIKALKTGGVDSPAFEVVPHRLVLRQSAAAVRQD